MPKDPNKHAVALHLPKEEYEALHAEALDREWSDKKLAEKIISWYLKSRKYVDLKVPLSPLPAKK